MPIPRPAFAPVLIPSSLGLVSWAVLALEEVEDEGLVGASGGGDNDDTPVAAVGRDMGDREEDVGLTGSPNLRARVSIASLVSSLQQSVF